MSEVPYQTAVNYYVNIFFCFLMRSFIKLSVYFHWRFLHKILNNMVSCGISNLLYKILIWCSVFKCNKVICLYVCLFLTYPATQFMEHFCKNFSNFTIQHCTLRCIYILSRSILFVQALFDRFKIRLQTRNCSRRCQGKT